MKLKWRLVQITAIFAAILAISWPFPFNLLLPKAVQQADNNLACPLGYTSDSNLELPAGHVPIPGMRIGTTSARTLGFAHNGTVWTADANATSMLADALLWDKVSGDILAVGTNAAAAAAAWRKAGAHVEALDLQGRFLMPGFIDPHTHFLQAGLFLFNCDVRGVTSPEHFTQVAATFVAKLEQQEQQQDQQQQGEESAAWLLGGQWDENSWGGALPHRSWLDAATGPNRPSLLSRMDSHMVVVNSRALQLAGITRDTPDPPGGIIDRDAAGEPTGILREAAIGLVGSLVPPPTTTQLMAALQAASDYALSRGVTMVGDLGRAPFTGNLETTWQDLLQVVVPAADLGQLRVRIYAMTPLQSWQRMASYVESYGRGHSSGMLFWGGVKEFADGSLGARTALMWEPYVDADERDGEQAAAQQYGTCMIEPDKLYELVKGADAARLQVAVHAIGDRAIDEVADVYARVARDNAALHASTAPVHGPPPRHRIEHAQHLSSPQAAERLAQLGILTTPNPPHLVADGDLMQRRLGATRAGPGHSYAFSTLTKAGVVQGYSSDWPVTDLHPVSSAYVAAFRSAPATAPGTGHSSTSVTWGPEEAISMESSLLGHTTGAAVLSGLGDYLGMLRPGMRADFVVLDQSPLDMAPGGPLPEVLNTYVNGQCRHGC